MGKRVFLLAVSLLCSCAGCLSVVGQTQDDDKDIWRKVNLQNVDYQQAKHYCQRIYAYYRFIDDGISYIGDRQQKLYEAYEGICELDVRYNKSEDDGAAVMVGRNLIHPEKEGRFIDFYELTPYTFLEKARRDSKHFTLAASGDTTRIFTKRGLAGTAVKDTLRKELHITYNALAPDTALSINLIYIKARLNRADADALYWYDETTEDYVPQGQLKKMVFDGDIALTVSMGGKNVRNVYIEHTEIYVDSVAYFTREEYKAEKSTVKERRKRCGYTQDDIDRLKRKLGVPPLSAETLQRIEDQRDWEDEYELWLDTDKLKGRAAKSAKKAVESEGVQKAAQEMNSAIESAVDKAAKKE